MWNSAGSPAHLIVEGDLVSTLARRDIHCLSQDDPAHPINQPNKDWGNEMDYRVIAENILDDIGLKLSKASREEFVDRMEIALKAAAARGRRVARVQMTSGRRLNG